MLDEFPSVTLLFWSISIASWHFISFALLTAITLPKREILLISALSHLISGYVITGTPLLDNWSFAFKSF